MNIRGFRIEIGSSCASGYEVSCHWTMPSPLSSSFFPLRTFRPFRPFSRSRTISFIFFFFVWEVFCFFCIVYCCVHETFSLADTILFIDIAHSN